MNFQSYSHTSGMVNSPPQSHHMDYPNNSAPVVNPRSASELIQDHGNKFRQLPCRTFISVGTCPYRERCVYLHDPRCICRDAKTKTRRKNKDDVVLDSMFWPIMSYNSVATKLDNNRQPHVIQPYVVPPAQNDQYRRHDEAVYSMWMHFVDSCLAMSESPQVHGRADAAPCFAAPDLPINAYTKQPRLPVMRVLSGANRREVSREELMAAEFGHFDSRGGSAAAEFPAKTYLRQLAAGTLHPSVYHGVRPQEEASKSEAKGSANSPNSVSLRSPPRATYADMANAQNIVDLCSNSVDSFHSIPEYDSNTSDSSRRSSLNDVKVDVKAGVERRSPDGPSLLWKQAQQPLNSGINTIESLKTFAGFSSTAMPSFLAFN